MDTQLISLYNLISQGGPPALLFVAVWGVLTGRWVPGSTYRQMMAERDEYKRLLLESLGLADKILHPGK